MITRAQIRRQLRKNGGVMNAVPRQQYGLGSIFKSITKPIKKVISSPVGKAALLGLGAYGLGGGFGSQGFGLGNIGPQIGRGLSAIKSGLFGAPAGMSAGPMSYLQKGVTPFSKGILGKLGLTGGGGKMMPTALGGITGASLLTYFMSKGATEEEAEELAQDVYRGKGLGMDQIRADMKNYRSGALSASQAHDKGYHFLTPQTYLGAQGGRVGLQGGGNGRVPIDPLQALVQYYLSIGASQEEAEVLATNAYEKGIDAPSKKAQGGRVGLASGSPHSELPTFSEGVKQMYVSDDLGALPKKGGGVLPEDMGKLKKENFDSEADYKRYLKRLNKKAQGGRIGYAKGKEVVEEAIIHGPQKSGVQSIDKIIDAIGAGAGISTLGLPKWLLSKLMQGGVKSNLAQKYNQLAKENKLRDARQLLTDQDPYTGRIGKYGGGIGAAMPRIPTGMPRTNAGGITELDYRQEGGFVPMGVKEKADDVPAMLSKNEFVMTADAVKAAGDGSVEKGAQRMYDTMKRLEGRVA